MSPSRTTSSPDGRARAVAVALRIFSSALAIALAAACPGCSRGSSGRGGCQAEADGGAGFEEQVLALVNQTRARGARCGGEQRNPVPALARRAELDCAARRHSRDMAARGFFDHENPDGERPVQRAARAGYADLHVGENLAWGQHTPAEVLDAWLNSPGHCNLLMSAEPRDTGLGYAVGAAGKTFWTQLFGRR